MIFNLPPTSGTCPPSIFDGGRPHFCAARPEPLHAAIPPAAPLATTTEKREPACVGRGGQPVVIFHCATRAHSSNPPGPPLRSGLAQAGLGRAVKVADREVGLARTPQDLACGAPAPEARGRRLGPALPNGPAHGSQHPEPCQDAPSRIAPGASYRGGCCLPHASNAYSKRGSTPRPRAGPPQTERRPTSAPRSATFRTNPRPRPARARCFHCARVTQRNITTGQTASEDEPKGDRHARHHRDRNRFFHRHRL